MDDFNSDTDSDYTSYWRDWCKEGATTKRYPLHRRPNLRNFIFDIICSLPVPPAAAATRLCASEALFTSNSSRSCDLSSTYTTIHASLLRKMASSRANFAPSSSDLWSSVDVLHPRHQQSPSPDDFFSDFGTDSSILEHSGISTDTLDACYDVALADLKYVGSYWNIWSRQHCAVLWEFGHWSTPDTLADRFISSRGNEYFCEIDEDYLTDRFNLTGLNTEVQYYQYALDLVTDVFDLDCDDEMRETIEKSARHLYGLVHARYIVTTRGLAKMLEKYKKADFGKCPRVMCRSHPLLPMGLSDNPNLKAVKLYCAKCEDLYNPKSSRHSAIDGAYFGTSFHNIIFQVYPALIPTKTYDRYVPRIYGFKVHAPATLIRWQNVQRDDMRKRLRKLEIETGFKEEEEEFDAEDSEAEEAEEEVNMDGVENGNMNKEYSGGRRDG